MALIRIVHTPDNDNADEGAETHVRSIVPPAATASTPPPPSPPSAPLFPYDEMPAQPMKSDGARDVVNPVKVIGRWATEGALVHEPTGIGPLDRTTGGGPVYGTRWAIIGAPDAGKTAFLVQIAETYARAGVVVGLLAVDEDPDDLVIRLAQRAGVPREQCERRNPQDIALIRHALHGLNIRIYDFGWTIEAAVRDLVEYAGDRRVFFGVDSLQTVRCDAEVGQKGTAENVAARMQAIRAVATRHKLIAFATSEMNRSGYASKKGAADMSPLALGKWSSDIEYQARVMLALSSVEGQGDTIKVEFAKNKHWAPGGLSRGQAMFLKIDRVAQKLTVTDAPPEPDNATQMQQLSRDVNALIEHLWEQDGDHTRGLEIWARDLRMGKRRLYAALEVLGEGVEKVVGANNSRTYVLRPEKLSEYWLSIYHALTGV